VAGDDEAVLSRHHDIADTVGDQRGRTNTGSDRAQLANVAKQAQAVLQTDNLDAVADRGYFSCPEILGCHEASITVMLPKPLTSGAKSEGPSASRTSSICPWRMSIAVRPASD
jgi:hypothetical protein